MHAETPDICRALFETAPDATIVADESGRIVLVNARAETLFGWSRAEMVGQPVEMLLPQRLRTAHIGHRARFDGASAPRSMDSGRQLLALRADGSEISAEIALGRVHSREGTLTVAAVRDVSDLARTRQAAIRGRYNAFVAQFGLRALAEPEFSSMIEAAGPLIAEAVQVQTVVTFRLTPDRREIRGIFGYGIPAATLERMHSPDDSALLIDLLVGSQEPLVTRSLDSEAPAAAMALLRRLGLASALYVPLFDGGEVIGGLIAASRYPRDWTEDDLHFMQAMANTLATGLHRTATDERLLHAQRLEALGQLTGGVAHDFNNLLMVITGNLQMLEDAITDRPEALALSRQAIGAAERGGALTRKLLAFARKQPLNPVPVDLNLLVTEFRDLVQRTFGEQVYVQLRLDERLPQLMADAAQVETALLNLALNARDAMPHGGHLLVETSRATLSASDPAPEPDLAAGDYARVQVTDTGTGMSPEVLARAIEPFFTTKDAGKGNGLGLSMVYGFVRQSGGTVRLRSEVGRGTTVALYLPIQAAAPGTAADEAPARVPTGSEVVLVVEDDAAVLGIAAGFLERLGYTTVCAGDGRTALGALQSHREVALLFTDLSLPDMDGIALAHAAREARPDIRVLYTTGYMSGTAMDRMPVIERAAVLAKPYRREDLALRVRALLAPRAAG
jgi:PAS domain S-box-containing protein